MPLPFLSCIVSSSSIEKIIIAFSLLASMLFICVFAFEERKLMLCMKNLSCNLNLYYLIENYFYLKSTYSKNVFIVVNEHSKNFFKTYCYENIHIPNCKTIL